MRNDESPHEGMSSENEKEGWVPKLDKERQQDLMTNEI